MLYLGAKKSLLSSGKTLAQQIAALFRSGEPGAWYEPSLTNGTLFQDSAGTTPVTAVGQPVGLMLDKSGRGNHARQVTAINRPVLQIDGNGRYFLAFNGTNSWMSTAAINFTGTDKMTVVAGVRKLSDAALGVVAEMSTIYTNPGAFLLSAPIVVGSNFGAGASSSYFTMGGFPSPVSAVVSAAFDLAGAARADEIQPRVNGVVPSLIGAGNASAGAGNFGNYPLYIGARAGSSLFFNGQLYGLIIRGALSSAPQIASAEKFMNSKTGAYA